MLELNQVDKAMEVMDQLIANYPEDARVFTLLGDGYMRQRQPEKAIELLKKAVELKPEQAVTRFQLGATLLSNKSTMTQGQQELITRSNSTLTCARLNLSCSEVTLGKTLCRCPGVGN
jgi:predicted Zn-dependent protease